MIDCFRASLYNIVLNECARQTVIFPFNFVINLSCSTAIQCPPPVIPVNGHLIQSEAAGMDGGRYAVGSLVQFACRGAYALEGEASIICTETGYWSHPPPFCKSLINMD